MPELKFLRLAVGRMAVAVACVSGGALVPAGLSVAQPAVQPSEAQLLEDFNFYVLTANSELARANAQALLDRRLDPKVFMGMVEDSPTLLDRFDKAYRRAILVPELEGVASELYGLFEQGRRERARDPEEIGRNIQLLVGTMRGAVLGRERLMAAGEYAVPQLVEVLMTRQNQALQTESAGMLASMGRRALAPLCAALLHVDPATQETIARTLGRIGYPAAGPYLTELARTTSVEPVRAAALRSLEQIGASTSPEMSLAALYRELGEEYYAEPKSLTAFPGEEHQLLWSYEPALGLQPTAVRTEVFHEAMAMRLAERALGLDGTDQESLALWLASNFSRELDQAPDYENPAYPQPPRRDATYYAVMAGAETTQKVLARALAERDTPLARRAIDALSRSAGVAGLVGPQGVPLVEALSYPDRRVRWEAALALGRAKPRVPFEGSERVVPTLASVIRDEGARYAVVLADELTRQQSIRSVLEGLGYTVLAPAMNLESAAATIGEAPGVDVIVTDLTTDGTVATIEQARSQARLQATPIIGMMSASGVQQHGAAYENERLTLIIRQGVSAEQLTEAVSQFVERASGAALSDEELRSYATAALNVLQELAVASAGAATQVSAYDVTDASVSLIGALTETGGGLRVQVADVLSYIGEQRAQVALMDAVMNAEADERLVMMSKMNASAKRFGNMLEERQVGWLLEAAESSTGEEATLAASLIGALNLPNEKLVPLIAGGAERGEERSGR